MLVITRRLDEEIVIDETIRIKLLSAENGRVRLGIAAPDDVRIRRSELGPPSNLAPPHVSKEALATTRNGRFSADSLR